MASSNRRSTYEVRRHLSRGRRLRRRILPLGVFAALVVGLTLLGARGADSVDRERVSFDRQAAAAYADRWALGNNPRYWKSGDSDCANFVSQCLTAGGLRPTDDPGLEWRSNGLDFPSVAWVNCEAQLEAFKQRSSSHTRYVVKTSAKLPTQWGAGDLVYLGNLRDGVVRWEHVIICVGKKGGSWRYSAHTTAHRRKTIATWYPRHFSQILYCRVADRVAYEKPAD